MFKIWFYRLRLEQTGKQESWIDEKDLAKQLDMHIQTVKLGMKYLVENGWLILVNARLDKIQEAENQPPASCPPPRTSIA